MSNYTQTYLVLLQPLAPFFFGGEQGETADYYLSGSHFPQQTALLGLIRHQLLIQNGLLDQGKINDQLTARLLIGAESFQYNKTDQDFGVITQLGECHLSYSPAFSNGPDETMHHYYPVSPSYIKDLVMVNNHFVFPAYNPKSHYPQNFQASKPFDKVTRSFTMDEIFSKTERPGIDKNYDGTPNDDAYYKQVWLTMLKGFSFCFYVSVKNTFGDNKPVLLNGGYVSFGKESSPFKMIIKQADNNLSDQAAADAGQNALCLTSDAYLPEDLSSGCEMTVTDTVPFRNVINSVSQEPRLYYNRKPAQIPGSKRLQLYKRGSVFYARNIQPIANKISLQKQFVTIGYNRFQFTAINVLS